MNYNGEIIIFRVINHSKFLVILVSYTHDQIPPVEAVDVLLGQGHAPITLVFLFLWSYDTSTQSVSALFIS